MTTSTAPEFDSLEIGHIVARRTAWFTRDSLVRYAGASGDFNPIHYNDEFAKSVDLPGVIAHGMLTLGQAASVVEEWAGPGNVYELFTRFTKPLPVPALSSTGIEFTVTVAALDEELRRATVDIEANAGDVKPLGRARAIVECV